MATGGHVRVVDALGVPFVTGFEGGTDGDEDEESLVSISAATSFEVAALIEEEDCASEGEGNCLGFFGVMLLSAAEL